MKPKHWSSTTSHKIASKFATMQVIKLQNSIETWQGKGPRICSVHYTSEEDSKAPLQLVVLCWDRRTIGNEKLVNLETKEHIKNGKTIFMGFVNSFFVGYHVLFVTFKVLDWTSWQWSIFNVSFWGQLQPLLMMLLGAIKFGVANFGEKNLKILP
jgi:hypothetical protein